MNPPVGLRTRMVLFFVALLAGVQLLAFAFVNQTSYATAQSKIEDELSVGERVFQRVLTQNAERLVQSARLLAADFAFREAVATRDLPTLRSALENHGERVHASAMMFVSTAGTVVASTAEAGSSAAPPRLAALLATARESGSSSGVEVWRGRPYQVVVVPVRAPVTIGWVVLWFAVDETLARDLRQLTNLDVSFVALDSRAGQVFASTLDAAAQGHLIKALPALRQDGRTQWLDAGDGAQQLRVLKLSGDGNASLAVVLERPIATALRNFHVLQTTLILLGAASLVVSVFGSVLIARGITAPIHRLLDSTEQMRQGDYEAAIDVSRSDEVGALAAGLDHMRVGIREREQRILRLAYEDPLTGLPNRLQFTTRLEAAVQDSERSHSPLVVFLMDLDRFKYINDALGHDVGDHVLRQVARRLRHGLSDADLVARLGGDEFAVLLPATGLRDAETVARRLMADLEIPIDYDGQPLDVTVSIGIAEFPDHGATVQTLLRNADIAMYVAKRDRGRYSIYDPGNDDSQREHLSLLGELRRAVDRDELELYYQPKLDIASAGVSAVEALIRWHHPQRGVVPPYKFIPFAEQTGYIKVLSRWVLEKAIRQAGEWRRRGIELRISVNLSTKDLINRELPEFLVSLLSRYAVPANAICIEITESGFMEDPAHVQKVLHRLSALGIPLSIDDYGTGYSSLTYLMQLPVSELKIDRSFVATVSTDEDLATVVRSTIELGHSLGLKVVAEGVEDPESLRLLTELHCDSAQGYLISPPLPVEHFETWLRGYRPVPPARVKAAGPAIEAAAPEIDAVRRA